MRYKGGVISATAPTTSTSTAKGIWTLEQQFQSVGASVWPRSPGAPTIGTATAGNASASVTFSAPTCVGTGSLTYSVKSTPGCFTNTGASSPIVVSGLTNCTAYTFKASGVTPGGTGPASAASNSATPVAPTCATYSTPGSYSFVVPIGVTSIAVVVIGGGGNGGASAFGYAACYGTCLYSGGNGGGGGGLAYSNGRTVTPGCSIPLRVAANNSGTSAATSTYFCCYTGTGVWGRAGGNGLVGNPNGNAGRNGASGVGGGNGGTSYGISNGAAGNPGSYNCTPQRGGYGGGAGGYTSNGGCGNGGSGVSGEPNISCSGSIGAQGGGGNGGYTSVNGSGRGGGGSGGDSAPATTTSIGGIGGSPGGGGGGGSGNAGNAGGLGATGRVRIVWAGGSRGTPSFPSTNVGP